MNSFSLSVSVSPPIFLILLSHTRSLAGNSSKSVEIRFGRTFQLELQAFLSTATPPLSLNVLASAWSFQGEFGHVLGVANVTLKCTIDAVQLMVLEYIKDTS